jgi:hypothetical protein
MKHNVEKDLPNAPVDRALFPCLRNGKWTTEQEEEVVTWLANARLAELGLFARTISEQEQRLIGYLSHRVWCAHDCEDLKSLTERALQEIRELPRADQTELTTDGEEVPSTLDTTKYLELLLRISKTICLAFRESEVINAGVVCCKSSTLEAVFSTIATCAMLIRAVTSNR